MKTIICCSGTTHAVHRKDRRSQLRGGGHTGVLQNCGSRWSTCVTNFSTAETFLPSKRPGCWAKRDESLSLGNSLHCNNVDATHPTPASCVSLAWRDSTASPGSFVRPFNWFRSYLSALAQRGVVPAPNGILRRCLAVLRCHDNSWVHAR